MVKKLKYLFILFTLFLITIIPNIDVKAVSFSTNGYSCVNFLNGNQYCSNVRQFNYDNIPYFGADFSYTPDNLEEVSYTVVDFRNQSFCPDNSSGGLLNFRFYHNYPFTNSVLNFIEATVNNKSYLCSTTLSQDGRYTEVSCPIGSGFSNQTLTFSYKINDLNFSFPFTAGFSNLIGETCNISTSDVINNNNQNTQDIINNQNQNNQNIINNNNSNTNQIIQDNQQNTQDIIDNQNQNTKSTNETIEKQFQSCHDSLNLFDINGQVTSSSPLQKYNNGFTLTKGTNRTVRLHLPETLPAGTYTFNFDLINSNLSSNNRFNVYPQLDYTGNIMTVYPLTNKTFTINSSFNQLQFAITNSEPDTATITIDNIMLTKGSTPLPFETYGVEICTNRLDDQTNSINNLNDTLNSEDNPNTNQDFNDMNDMVASNTPISDLITMPLTLVNAYINGINSTCSPVNLGNLYGTNLTLPCINLESRLGSNLWSIIDTFFCIFMCYNIGMLFVSAFDGITSLRDDFEGLYQPRHADIGYQPRHGGGN